MVKCKVPSLEVELTAPAENTLASCTDSIPKNLLLTGSGGLLLLNPPNLFIPHLKLSVRVKVKDCFEFGIPCFTPSTRHMQPLPIAESEYRFRNGSTYAFPLFLPFTKWGVCVALLQCAQDESFSHNLMVKIFFVFSSTNNNGAKI